MRTKLKHSFNFDKITHKWKVICRPYYISNSTTKYICKLLTKLKRTHTVLMLVICVFVSEIVIHVKQTRQDQQLSNICYSVLEIVHIANTGGTSIEKKAVDAGISWGMYHFLNMNYFGYHSPNWKHATIIPWTNCSQFHNKSITKRRIHGIYLRPNPYKGFKTFTVVRNPYTRMISNYYSKWSGYKHRLKHNGSDLNTWIQNNILTNFCGDVHGFLQHLYVFNGGRKIIDHVLRFENLVLEFNALMDKYNLPIQLANGLNVGENEKLAFQELTAKAKKMIGEYARKDFELLQYTYDVCGNLNLTRAISHALFPESIESLNSNIMFVRGACNKTLNRVILYLNGRNGKLQIPQVQNMFFMEPLHCQNPTSTQTLPYVHVVGTTLMNPSYSANDFLRRRIQPAGQRRFMVYTSSNCLKFREKIFNDIVNMARNHNISLPVAIGKCHGSYSNLSEFKNDSNAQVDTYIQQISTFRFALVIENSNEKGYITEQIANAFMANTIPIYYGTTEVFRLFNKHAFIYYDIINPASALERIVYLESNQTAYERVLSQPILASGYDTLEDYFSISDDVGGGKIKHHIRTALISQSEIHTLQLKNTHRSIPREIYMLWHSGWENAPKWHKTCLRTWQYFNPTHIVHALDLRTAEQLIDRELMISNLTWDQLKIQAKSDIIRILILSVRGGFWADASVACNKPLDKWIDYWSDFITFRRDDKDSKIGAGPKHQIISPWITSWFIGGPTSSYVLQQMRNSVLKFWLTPNFPYEYYWLHRLFADLVAYDKAFLRVANVSNLPSGDGPHCLVGDLEQQTMFKRCNQLYVYSKEKNYLI